MNEPTDNPTEIRDDTGGDDNDDDYTAEDALDEIHLLERMAEEEPGFIHSLVSTHPLATGLGAMALGFLIGRSRRFVSMGISLAVDALQPLAVNAIQDYLSTQLGDVEDIFNAEE